MSEKMKWASDILALIGLVFIIVVMWTALAVVFGG